MDVQELKKKKLCDRILYIDFRLLTGKNVENQTLESLSASVQKRFSKSDYLSGK